jgi:hypothetical protein
MLQLEQMRVAKTPLRFSARPIIAQLIRSSGAFKLLFVRNHLPVADQQSSAIIGSQGLLPHSIKYLLLMRAAWYRLFVSDKTYLHKLRGGGVRGGAGYPLGVGTRPPRKFLIWLWCGGFAAAPEPHMGILERPGTLWVPLQTARLAGDRVSRVI